MLVLRYRRYHIILEQEWGLCHFSILKVHVAVSILRRKHPPLQVYFHPGRPGQRIRQAVLIQELLEVVLDLFLRAAILAIALVNGDHGPPHPPFLILRCQLDGV